MVGQALPLKGIKDERVIAAMRKVPRERFMPDEIKSHAYDDKALPIGFGQTISQPYVVGLMTQLLELHGTEKVLEVGTGSGYQTAILAELAKEVYSIEIIPELVERASRILKELGYSHVHVIQGDGYQGWPEKAPFDAITVTCAPDHVPQPLVEQLKEGGRMVIPVGASPGRQMLQKLEKTNGRMVQHPVTPVSFVPMTGDLGDPNAEK